MVGTRLEVEQAAQTYDYLFKLVLVGPEAVGKSSSLLRFVDDNCSLDYIATIGVDFKTKNVNTADDEKVKLQIWDTAGQERFRVISNAYYRGAHGVMLYFDTTNRASFDSLGFWYDDVKSKTLADCPIVLVGTKCDLKDERAVHQEEAEAFASEHNLPFIEISAKANTRVSEAFQILTDEVMMRHRHSNNVVSMSTMPGALMNKSSSKSASPQRASPKQNEPAMPKHVPGHQRVNKKSKSCTIL